MPGVYIHPVASEPVHRELREELDALRKWMRARTLRETCPDLLAFGARLRALWLALKAAGALETLRTWRSARGLGEWDSHYGQVLRTGSVAESGLMHGDHAATDDELPAAHADWLGRMLSMRNHNDVSDVWWLQFRDAMDEYAEEVLAALAPTEDHEAIDAMREAIQNTPFGRKTRPTDLGPGGVGRQRALKALRTLEARGEYEGFCHKPHRRRQ